MKEKPILFSTQMVRSILKYQKIMTRRVVNPQPDEDCYYEVRLEVRNGNLGVVYDYNQSDQNPFIKCPWQIGDLLWVRESFSRWSMSQGDKALSSGVYFKADFPDGYLKSTPSIFMPKDIARIWLEVTKISVEHLQYITDDDAMCEGINKKFFIDRGYSSPESMESFAAEGYYRRGFMMLWKEINGEESWNRNPLVWRITFKFLTSNGKSKLSSQNEVSLCKQ